MKFSDILSDAQAQGSDGVSEKLSFTAEDLKKLLESSDLTSLLKGVKTSARIGKTRKVKDPNKPKRGKSAYLFYTHSTETKAAFKETYPEKWDDEKQQPKPITELTKFAAGQWKQMDEDAKAPYAKLASSEKERYDAEMSEYRPTASVAAVLDDSEMPEAPDGWSGPFQGYYLFKNAAGRKTFKCFAEALAAADELDDCLGITKTAQGYSLRKMEGGQPIPTDKPAVSWVKGEVEVTKMVVSTKKIEKVSVMDESTDTHSNEAHADIASHVSEESSDGSSVDVVSANVSSEVADGMNDEFDPNGDDEFGNETEEDDDDDAPEVSRWTYQETEYLVDDASGVVYDSEKFENDGEVVEIGQRVPNTPEGKFVATDD